MYIVCIKKKPVIECRSGGLSTSFLKNSFNTKIATSQKKMKNFVDEENEGLRLIRPLQSEELAENKS
jgi:hypothetical protein